MSEPRRSLAPSPDFERGHAFPHDRDFLSRWRTLVRAFCDGKPGGWVAEGSIGGLLFLYLRTPQPLGDVVAPEVGGPEVTERDLGGLVPGLAHEVGEPSALVAGSGGEPGPQRVARSSAPASSPAASAASFTRRTTALSESAFPESRPVLLIPQNSGSASRASGPKQFAKIRRGVAQRQPALERAAGQVRGSAGLAQIATCWPRPYWSVLERRTSTVTPRPGTSWTSPMRRPTSSERRSAAPKPSSSMARFRIAERRGGGGEGGQHFGQHIGHGRGGLAGRPDAAAANHALERHAKARLARDRARPRREDARCGLLPAPPGSRRRSARHPRDGRCTSRPGPGRRRAARGRGRGTTGKNGSRRICRCGGCRRRARGWRSGRRDRPVRPTPGRALRSRPVAGDPGPSFSGPSRLARLRGRRPARAWARAALTSTGPPGRFGRSRAAQRAPRRPYVGRGEGRAASDSSIARL